MSEDPIRAYQEAVGRLEAASRVADGEINGFMKASVALAHWHEVGTDGLSMPVGMRRTTIGAHQWLSYERLGEMLAEWHAASIAVNELWSAIPEERRVGLQAPRPV